MQHAAVIEAHAAFVGDVTERFEEQETGGGLMAVDTALEEFVGERGVIFLRVRTAQESLKPFLPSE